METATYTSAESQRNVFQPQHIVPLVKVKTTNFIDEPCTMATANKLCCFTCKKPSEVRILDRIKATKCDKSFDFSIKQIVSLSDTVFAAAGGNFVVVLTVESHADDALSSNDVIIDLEDECKAICAGGKNVVLATTVSGKLVVITDGKKSATIPLAAAKPVKSAVLAAQRELSLVITPGKGSGLDVLSLNSEKSVLAKPWVPHGEDLTTSAFFIHRVLSGVSDSHKLIVTAANGNNELRFWTMGDSGLTLVQQLSIHEEDEKPSPERSMVLSSNEEYIILASKSSPSIVVVELDRTLFKASRVTDWATSSPVLCCAGVVRKQQEGKSMTIEQGAMIRTAEMIQLVTFDASKLVGSSNVGASKPVPAPKPQDNVAKWFGGETVSSPLLQTATTVSSSVTGKIANSGDSSYAIGQAVSAIRSQSTNFRESLAAIDEQIVSIQKHAGSAVKALQDAKSREEAQLAGREFALRNKHRLVQQPQQAGSAQMSAPQAELMLGVRNFVESLTSAVKDSTQKTCKRTLQASLSGAIAKAMAQADAAEQDAALPKLSVTEGMQIFGSAVDKIQLSQSNLLRNERNTVESFCARMMTGSDRIGRTVESSKAFLASLKSELRGLQTELKEAKEVVRKAKFGGSGVAAAAPISAEELVAEALKLSHAGNWKEAVAKVERTGDLGILMHFLEHEFVQENKVTVIDPNTLTLPIVVQLCYRLAHDIRSSKGNIPFRTQWIYDFVVEWDDTLTAMKEKDAKSLAGVKEPLQAVVDNLDTIERNEVDRSTKNRITLVRRLLTQLLQS